MAHIPGRWDGLGSWCFVTVVTYQRQPVFADESACKVLQNSFHETHHYYPFRLGALVILPEHWHALIRPGIRDATRAGTRNLPRSTNQEVVIERVVGAVKRNVLQDLQVKGSTIWQTRFLDHRIRDEDDFLHHVEYIRLNPEKHSYVTEPDQYGWCFIHNRPFS